MVLDELLGSTGGITQIFSSIMSVVIISLVVVVVAGLMFFFWLAMSYRHKVVIKESVDGNKIESFDRAKEYVDEDGVTWWKLLKEKNKHRKRIAAPPSDCLSLDHKGNKVFHVYLTDSGEYVPAKDKGLEYEYIKDGDSGETKRRAKGLGFSPFPINQRLIYMHQIRKAESKIQKTFMQQLLVMTPVMLVIILAIVGMAQWDEMTENAVSAQKEITKQKQLDKETFELLEEIKKDIQRIDARTDETQEEKPPE